MATTIYAIQRVEYRQTGLWKSDAFMLFDSLEKAINHINECVVNEYSNVIVSERGENMRVSFTNREGIECEESIVERKLY